MIIGQPFTLPPVEEDAINKNTLSRLTDELMRPIAANLPPEQQGYYRDINTAAQYQEGDKA